MASELKKLPLDLQRGFLAYYHRQRTYRAVSIFLSALILYVLLVWIAIHLDRFLALTTLQRVRLFEAVHGIVGLTAAARLLVLFLRRCPVKATAYALEARLGPALQERYSTLVDVLNRKESELSDQERQLVVELTNTTLELGAHHRTARLAHSRALRWWGVAAAAALLGFFLPPLIWPCELGLMLKRFYQPQHAHPRPCFVKIELLPAPHVVGAGHEFVLQAKTQGAVPRIWTKCLKLFGRELKDVPEIEIRSAAARGEPVGQRRELTRIGHRLFLFTQTVVSEDFGYRVRCGDAETPWSQVEVVPVPCITEVSLRIMPPSYSGMAPENILFSGQTLVFLKGTRVKVEFKTDQALKEWLILCDILDKPVVPAWDEQTRTGTWQFDLRDNLTLRLKVRNARGFENEAPVILSFALLEDHSPSVFLKADEVLPEQSATDHVALPFLAEDDYGIAEMAVSYILNPLPGQTEGAKEVNLPVAERQRSISHVGSLDLCVTDACPGDRVLVRIRARDTAGQSGLSQGVLIHITSFGREAREETRINALRFLARSLAAAAESTGRSAGPGEWIHSINQGIYRHILEEAGQAAVTVSQESSFRSLFEAIEREHFLTSSPWDKEDIRHLHAALELSVLSALRQEEPIESRNQTVMEIVDDILRPLIDYRELRNLMWRCFGLRDAAAMLAGSPAPADADKLALIFTTVERSLARLLDLASRVKSLDTTGLREELNCVARIRKSVLAEEQAAAPPGAFAPAGDDTTTSPTTLPDPVPKLEMAPHAGRVPATVGLGQLCERLSHVLVLAQGAILDALQRHGRAKDALDRLYLARMADLMESPARAQDFEGWWQTAVASLEKDSRLIQAEPYLALWPLVRNYGASAAILDMVRYVEEPPRDGAARPPMFAFSATAPPVFQRYTRAQDELFTCSSLLALERIRSISPMEKEFAARLAVVELEARYARAADDQKDALRTMSLAHPPSAPLPWLSCPESVCVSKADYLGLEGEVRAALLECTATNLIVPMADFLLTRLKATTEAITQKSSIRRALVLEQQLLRCLVERVYLELMAIPAATDTGAPLEMLYLKLREFRDRPPISLRLLRDGPGEGRLRPGDFDDVNLDYAAVGRHRQAEYARLADIIRRFRDQTAQKLDDYQEVLAAEFAKTRGHVIACAGFETAEGAGAVAREYVGSSEEATMIYFAFLVPRLSSVMTHVQEAQAALQAKPGDRSACLALMNRAQQALNRYLKDVATARPSAFKERITAQLENAGTILERLRAEQGNAETAAYEMDRVVRKLQDASRETASYAARVGRLRFTGAACNSGKGLSAVRVFETGQLLADDFEFRRELVHAGIFEMLSDEPRMGLREMALSHAVFLYRIVRGELAEFRPLEPILGQSGYAPPSYIGYLQEVLREAGKINIRYYQDIVPPYLQRMGSYKWELPKKP
jgi:hypothetical protein